MKKYEINPRKVKSDKLNDLHDSLDELGDISGIVHDEETNEIISGNQRSKVISINNCEIVIEEEYAKPDRQGTTAYGYVVWEGERYFYRRVKWTEKQRQKACIKANISTGEWDFGGGYAKEFGEQNLMEWGVPEESLPAPEFKPNSTGEEEIKMPTYPEQSGVDHVRMIQIFLNSKSVKVFAKHEEHLRNKYGTENVGDTMMNAAKEVYIKLKAQ